MAGFKNGIDAAIAYLCFNDSYHPVHHSGNKAMVKAILDPKTGPYLDGSNWIVPAPNKYEGTVSFKSWNGRFISYLLGATYTSSSGLKLIEEQVTVAAGGVVTLSQIPIGIFAVTEVPITGYGTEYRRVTVNPPTAAGEYYWDGLSVTLTTDGSDVGTLLNCIYHYATTTGAKIVIPPMALSPSFGMQLDVLHITDPANPLSNFSKILLKKCYLKGDLFLANTEAGGEPVDKEMTLFIENGISGDVTLYTDE